MNASFTPTRTSKRALTLFAAVFAALAICLSGLAMPASAATVKSASATVIENATAYAIQEQGLDSTNSAKALADEEGSYYIGNLLKGNARFGWDSSVNGYVLILDNATISDGVFIYDGSDLYILNTGTSTIKGMVVNVDETGNIGVIGNGTLNIASTMLAPETIQVMERDGKLTVNVGDSADKTGLIAIGGLGVDKATVNVKGKEYGIVAYDVVGINGATISAKQTASTASSKKLSDDRKGAFMCDTLTLVGSTVSATAGGKWSSAISADSDISASNSAIKAYAKNSGFGIMASQAPINLEDTNMTVYGAYNAIRTNTKTITINGGKMCLYGKNSKGSRVGCGIISTGSVINLYNLKSGSTISAKSAKSKYGIYSTKRITISNSKLSITAKKGYAMKSKGKVKISGGTVKVNGKKVKGTKSAF